jgi:hypothetical protein
MFRGTHVWLADVKSQLKALRFCSASDMEVLETSDHIVVQRRSLVRTAVPILRNYTHGEVLGFQLSIWRFDADYGRWAKKPLFTSVGLLRNGSVEADDSGHGHDTRIVHDDMVADCPAYLALRLLRRFVELPLAG